MTQRTTRALSTAGALLAAATAAAPLRGEPTAAAPAPPIVLSDDELHRLLNASPANANTIHTRRRTRRRSRTIARMARMARMARRNVPYTAPHKRFGDRRNRGSQLRVQGTARNRRRRTTHHRERDVPPADALPRPRRTRRLPYPISAEESRR